MPYIFPFRIALCVLACLISDACTNRASFSLTANVSAQYSNVWITVDEIWLNTRQDAGPEDAGWVKFTLGAPETFDLVALTNGTMVNIASGLKIPSGTYTQLRLFLADAADSLTSSAQQQGLRFNNEVDSFNSAGTTLQLPLRLANSARGVGVVMDFTATTSGTAIFKTTSPSSDSLSSSSSAVIDFDAARDLTLFSFSDKMGYFLNPHLAVIDRAHVGTIQSQIDVSAIAADPNTGRRDIQVSAETISDDGSRHVIVKSAPLRADGSFSLYPISMASGDPSQYDLVFHGPAVRTVIVKSVPIAGGDPASAADVTLTGLALSAASSFDVNLSTNQPVGLRGARVGFYQTPAGSDDVPYLIEERPVDPFSGLFDTDQVLSADDLATTTFVQGQPVTVNAAAPKEGASTYTVAALAAPFADGPLDQTVNASNTLFVVSEPTVPQTASVNGMGFTFTVATPARFDRGQLIVTHNGTIVSAVSLDQVLAQPQNPPSLSLNGLPATLYYAEAWVWNSNDPTATIEAQPHTAGIDLHSGSVSGIAVGIQ